MERETTGGSARGDVDSKGTRMHTFSECTHPEMCDIAHAVETVYWGGLKLEAQASGIDTEYPFLVTNPEAVVNETQSAKCGRGEHESDGVAVEFYVSRVGFAPGTEVNERLVAEVCTHCRCFFVAR